VPQRPELALPVPLDSGLLAPIRVVPGPQDDYFSAAAIETLLSATYTISAQADRMGFRLEGEPLEHSRGYNIVSDAIVAGSIQVPGSGQPIVLLVDAQTTGGYPKIATVASADLPVLGRRRPGDQVRFRRVSQPESEALRREQEVWIREVVAGLSAVRRGGLVDPRSLYGANLISGMIDALAEEGS
jgi:allophanate hydrolase